MDEGTLPIRVSLLIRVIEAAIKKESLLNLGIKTGFGNDWLRIGGVKMSIDGGITGHVAKFYEPDVDDPCHEGLIRIEQDELDETVNAYHCAGHRVCIHAIGDVAMDMALRSLERPSSPFRATTTAIASSISATGWSTTSACRSSPATRSCRFRTSRSCTHLVIAARLHRRETAQNSFNLRDMLAAGLQITSGSDGPAYWPLDSLRDLGTAVSRRTRNGQTVGPDQAISVRDAIRMFTINAAYNAFEEKIKGSIEIGKVADFAVLAEIPYEIAPENIKDIPVDMTVVNGKIAFMRDGADDLDA